MSLVELFGIRVLNLKSPYIEFTTDASKQEEVKGEVGHNLIGSGLDFSRSMRSHPSETRGKLVNLDIF